MKIKQLTLSHYRNYTHLNLALKDGLTLITGENAQGKTNLLEAIFLLSLAKSHRTNHDSDLIQWEHEHAQIEGVIESRHYDFPLTLGFGPKGKVAKVNHVEQAKLSQFIGKFNVVLFASEDLQLVKGSPALRRRFLDGELGQSHPVYLQALVDYQRILKQRNRYLKEYGRSSQFDALYFEVLTDQLIEKAVEIAKHRLEFIRSLQTIAQPIHQALSNQRDSLTLTYIASSSHLDYTQMDTLADQFKTLFNRVLTREKDRGMTLYGVHRDDVTFLLNDAQAQLFASQGQQRTIVLALKLAEIEWLYQRMGEYPVLLLDDVLSELDDQRQHILMQRIEGKVQTFLTTASIKGIQRDTLSNVHILYVNHGEIIEGGHNTDVIRHEFNL